MILLWTLILALTIAVFYFIYKKFFKPYMSKEGEVNDKMEELSELEEQAQKIDKFKRKHKNIDTAEETVKDFLED